MQIKDAVEQLVTSVPLPEQELEEMFLGQNTGPRRSPMLNIFFFFVGMTLLGIGIYRTYLFTSQEDPHGAVIKQYEDNDLSKRYKK
jgi:hypothetical protein